MKIKSEVILKKGPHGWEAWQTNKLIAKVHGFDNGAKEEVLKHVPGYENVIESGVKGMNTEKKAWLIKVSIDNHTYDDGVMICDEETVKKYCKDKTAESEMENYDSDLDDIDWTVYSYSYQPIELVEEPIMNGYERNAGSINQIFSRVEGDTWTDSKGNTWMYHEGVPDEKLDYDVNEDVPDREKYHAYKMFVTKYNPANKRTWNEKGKLYPLYINAKNYYEIGPWYKCGYGASQVLIDEFTHEPLYDKNGKMKVKTYEKGLAFRPGGHAGGLPLMRHRGRKDLPHNGDNDFDYFHSQEVFAEIEFSGHYDYTDISKQRQANSENPNDPYEAGFTDINDLNTNGMGYYRFKTNTNASDDEAWFIASAFRIVRVISDNEMRKIIGDYNAEHGTNFKPQMRGAPNGSDGDKFNADFTQFGIENSFRRRNK